MTRAARRLAKSLRARISDERVLEAIAAVPRERFVRADLIDDAYEDRALPNAHGQTISQPTVVALMCEALELQPDDRVLDVGLGSGYHAAVLAHLCAHVYGIERDRRLATAAVGVLADCGIDNVTVAAGDGRDGWPEHAPFQAINVAAAARHRIPEALEEQLAPGGRLIAPLADGVEERLTLVRRTQEGLERTTLGAVRFVPLR